MENIRIAEICHEVNRAYCDCMGLAPLLPWSETPENIKQSAIDGVKFHIENPNSSPSDAHNNWMKFKIADGWSYGEIKNTEKKTHPCLIPYESLPKAEQVKDYIFMTIVKTINEGEKCHAI